MRRLSIKSCFKDDTYYAGLPGEPVSVADAKAWMFIESTFTDDDALIQSMISQARNMVESFCGISIVQKLITLTWAWQSNAGPYKKNWDINFFNSPAVISMDGNDWYELPHGPVKYVASVTGMNKNVLVNMVRNTDFYLLGDAPAPGQPGVDFNGIQFASWYDNFILVYKVGYDNVPPALKEAILNEVTFRYANRGDNTSRYAQQNVGLCEAAEYLASQYRRVMG